jgi:hypothetical protein
MNFKKAFLITLSITTIFCIVFLFLTIIQGYDGITSNLIKLFNFEDYSDQIKLLFSENKYRYFQILLIVQIVFFAIMIKNHAIIFNKTVLYLHDLRDSLLKLIRNMFNRHVILILLIPLCTVIFYAFYLPITYDEAWTYLNFTSKNIFISLSYYPAPNNHILHSVLTNISYFIFADLPKFSLRLPTVIVFIFTILISFSFLTKHYNLRISILVTAIFPVLAMSIYYGYLSRGYQLIMMFFILALHFAHNIKETHKNKDRDWFWFTFFSILGFLTIPSYLYAYIITNTILLIDTNKSIFEKQLKSFACTLMGVFILYLPTVLMSGLNSLIGNQFVIPISRDVVISKLPEFLTSSLESIFGLSYFLPLTLILLMLILLFKSQNWFNLKSAFIFLTLPMLLLVLHSVIPFSRTFNYYAFTLIFLFVISIQKQIQAIRMRNLIIAAVCIQALLVYNFSTEIFEIERYTMQSHTANSLIIKDDKTYTVNSSLFDAFLFFELKTNKKINKYNVKYFSSIKMNADTIFQSDYIIIDKDIDETKNKKPILTNDFINVY